MPEHAPIKKDPSSTNPRKPVICLTFDLEEFDLPLEYKQPIEPAQQFEMTVKGMHALLPLLGEFNCRCTFFTTANFAEHHKELIKELSRRHEVASHCYFHSSYSAADLARSKEALGAITGIPVAGFRMPRMQSVDYSELEAAGYRYDSSLHPTWIPGRYNHFSKPRTIHRAGGMIIFPASVTPVWRSPLFWLSFKNVSPARYNRWVEKCLAKDGYANIYLHPWEFTDLGHHKLPRYIAKDAHTMCRRLRSFLAHFQHRARFLSIGELLHERDEL